MYISCLKSCQTTIDLGKISKRKKSQNWLETQASVQSLLQKLFFGYRCQNVRKSRCQSFLVLSIFCLIFLLFVKYFITDCRYCNDFYYFDFKSKHLNQCQDKLELSPEQMLCECSETICKVHELFTKLVKTSNYSARQTESYFFQDIAHLLRIHQPFSNSRLV